MYFKTIIGIIAIAAVLLLFFCQCEKAQNNSPEVEYLNTGETTGRPFSKAVRVGHMLYLSGELGIDLKTGKLAPGGIAAETKQAMENIKNTLEEFGSSLDRVVKCTVMLADINEWQPLSSGQETLNRPSSSC